jgi:sec-independent protein translocase protein TatB
VLALIVLGPDKLPTAARQAGRWMAEFRRISGGFQSEFRRAVDSAMDDSSDYQGFELPQLSDVGLGAGVTDSYNGSSDEDHVTMTALDDTPTVSLDKPDPSTAPAPSSATIGNVDVDGPSTSFS